MEALLIAIGVVVLVSAMCSLLEAVFLSVPLTHIEALAQEGKASGRIFRRLKQPQQANRAITAILSLNTFANTGGAVVAGAAFIKVFGKESEAYFTVSMMFAVLILSEVVPKTVGFLYNRPLSNLLARPLAWLVFVFSPMIWLTGLLTRVISGNRQELPVSGEELVSMARMGLKSGSIDEDEARVIQNILSLKTRAARDIMTPRTVVFALPEQATIDEAHGQAGIWAHSRVPVYGTDLEDIVGIVLRRDVLTGLAQGRREARLGELMRPVHFVAESHSLDLILTMFLQKREHLFAVVDEFGGLAGVLTLEDVLEEILGREIVDELDEVVDLRALARRRRRDTLSGNNPL